jgi:hypothetical protein
MIRNLRLLVRRKHQELLEVLPSELNTFTVTENTNYATNAIFNNNKGAELKRNSIPTNYKLAAINSGSGLFVHI